MKDQKLKAKLRDKNSENNRILAELQVVRQKINNMEKQNKDLGNVKIKRDSLPAILKEIDANYYNLKAEKDIMNVEHNKIQRDYKSMEHILLKHQKELEDLIMEVGNVY
jgi:chromosome segregation ATPase